MDTSALAQAIKDALGPQWWDMHVRATTTQAQGGVVIGLILLLVTILVVGALVRYATSSDDGDDQFYGAVFAAVAALVGGAISIGVLIVSFTTLAAPDLAVWRDLVTAVGTVLK